MESLEDLGVKAYNKNTQTTAWGGKGLYLIFLRCVDVFIWKLLCVCVFTAYSISFHPLLIKSTVQQAPG